MRAGVPRSHEDVARGTTNEVKTLQTVSTTMAMPATSATKRANSTAPSCQMPGRRRLVGPPVRGSDGGEPRRRRPARHEGGGHVDEAGPKQLTEAFRLRVQAQVRRTAPTEDPVDDEVDRPQVRERVSADRKGLDLG